MSLPILEEQRSPLYLLVDGAVVDGAERLCYELAVNQDIDVIYRGTELDPVSSMGPIICPLKENHLLLNTLTEKKPYDWGIVLEASGSTYEVAEHLRTTIKADLGTGSSPIFRFYLPHVISPLAHASTDIQKKRIFGPISQIWTQSRSRTIDQWKTIEISYREPSSSRQYSTWMKLSDKQITALGLAAKKHFTFRAFDHIHQHFPNFFKGIETENQYQKIVSYIDEAKSYGLGSEQEVLSFINILCMLGDDIMAVEKYNDVKELLTNKETLMPSDRVQQALTRATEYYELRESLDG